MIAPELFPIIPQLKEKVKWISVSLKENKETILERVLLNQGGCSSYLFYAVGWSTKVGNSLIPLFAEGDTIVDTQYPFAKYNVRRITPLKSKNTREVYAIRLTLLKNDI